MEEIHSTEISFICESIQKTLDDLNGIADCVIQKENGLKTEQIEPYSIIKSFIGDDGKIIANLSRRFSYEADWLEFLVMFEEDYYKELTITGLAMINELNLNIENRVLETSTFLQFFTFNISKLDVAHKSSSSKCLNVKYKNCVVNGFKEYYDIGMFVKLENCIFLKK